MRRPIRTALLLATLAIAALLNSGLNRYTHPNLADRSTEDLSREVMDLVLAHQHEPYPLQWPHFERQRVISEELAKRQPALLAQLRAEDEADTALADSCGLALAGPQENQN